MTDALLESIPRCMVQRDESGTITSKYWKINNEFWNTNTVNFMGVSKTKPRDKNSTKPVKEAPNGMMYLIYKRNSGVIMHELGSRHDAEDAAIVFNKQVETEEE